MAEHVPYEDVLTTLLNTPQAEQSPNLSDKQIAENAKAVANGELPEGVNMEAMLDDLIANNAVVKQREEVINNQVTGLMANQAVLAEASAVARDNLITSRSEGLDATIDAIENQGEINISNVLRDTAVDAEFQLTVDARDIDRAQTEAELDTTFDSLLMDYNLVEEESNLGLMDLIRHPIDTVRAGIEAKKAEERIVINKDRVAILDTKNQLNARVHQQSINSYQVEKTLLQLANVDQYAKQEALNTSVQVINAGSANFTAITKDLQEFYNLKDSQLSNFETQLRILHEQGNANANNIEALAKSEQYKYAKLQTEELNRALEEQEGLRVSLDPKVKEIGIQLGIPELDSVAALQTMTDNELLTNEKQYLIQTLLTSGTLGVPAFLNADSPYLAGNAILSADRDSIPTRMQNLMLNIDNMKVGNTKVSDLPGFDDDPVAVRDSFYKLLPNAVNADIDTAIDYDLAEVMSPHMMELDKIQGFPVELIEDFSTIKLDTHSFDAYAKSAATLVGSKLFSSQELTAYSNAFSILSNYQLQGINKTTALGIEHMKVDSFENPITKRAGDMTNPNDWHNYLTEAYVKAQRLRAPQF